MSNFCLLEATSFLHSFDSHFNFPDTFQLLSWFLRTIFIFPFQTHILFFLVTLTDSSAAFILLGRSFLEFLALHSMPVKLHQFSLHFQIEANNYMLDLFQKSLILWSQLITSGDKQFSYCAFVNMEQCPKNSIKVLHYNRTRNWSKITRDRKNKHQLKLHLC